MRSWISRNKTVLICFIVPVLISFSYIFEMKGLAFARLNNTFESYIYYANGTDMAAFFRNASKFYQGEWPPSIIYRAPLYTFFIIVMSLFTSKVFTIVIVQAFLFLVTLCLTYEIALELFDKRVGILSILSLSFYGGFVFWVAVPHSTVLETTLCTLAFLALLKYRRNFNNLSACIVGGAGALLCLIRPNFLVIVPVAVFFIFWEKIRSTNEIRSPLYSLCLCALCFISLLIPVTIWNNIHSDRFIFFTNNGSSTFRIANSYDSCVYNFIYPKKPVMPITSSAFWKHQIKKFLGYWTAVEYPQNVNFYIYKSNSIIIALLPINFGVIGALFIGGTMLFSLNFRRHWLLLWFVWGYVLTIVVFFIIGRFRIPVVPLMVVLGVGFVFKVFEIVKLLRKAPDRVSFSLKTHYVICVLAFIAVFALSNPLGQYISDTNWINSSNHCLNELDLEGYANALRHSVAIRPYPLFSLNIIAAEALSGHFDDAERSLGILLRSHPNHAYLLMTKREIDLLRRIEQEKLPFSVWRKYLKNRTGGTGQVFNLYQVLRKCLQKREEFGFHPKRIGAYPVSFFRLDATDDSHISEKPHSPAIGCCDGCISH